MARLGVLRGTFLRPGVSKNRRWYTPENIGKAVERMNARIEAGRNPTMMSSHLAAADDDSLKLTGRLTKVGQRPDGSAWFEADIAPTDAGRDIATLVDPQDPWLKTVSIRGAWVGDVQKVPGPDGQEAYTADDLDIEGVDWTGRPGVEGAEIEYAALGEARPENAYRIFESTSDAEFFVEEVSEGGNAPGDGSLPYGKVKYADPGYQQDGKKRYPIDTEKHVRAAWGYVNQASNASKYSSAQLARIKGKIKSAARKFGINIAAESAALIADIESSLIAVVGEGADVTAIAERLAFESLAALYPLDESEAVVSDDDNMEGELGGDGCDVCGHTVPDAALYCPTCGSPLPLSDAEPESNSEEEAPVADTETQTQESAEAILTEASKTTYTLEDVLAAYAAGVASSSASAGPKPDAPGRPGKSPDQPKPVESDADGDADDTREHTQEGETMTEGSKAPAGYTTEQVEEMVKKAAKKAAREAVEAFRAAQAEVATEAAPVAAPAAEAAAEAPQLTEAEIREAALEAVRAEAVREYRESGAAARKGLVPGAGTGNSLTEADYAPENLAKMGVTELRRATYEAAQSDPFFQRLYAHVDANAGR